MRLSRLMRLRLAMNRRMPRWRRMEDWVKVKLADSGWRRPKGNDNKIRLERKGYPPRVKVGYGKPRLVRNLHPSGYRIAIVHSPVELDKLNPEKDAIMLGGDVGLRKRIEIIRRARERGFKVLNITKEEAKLFAEEKAQG